MSGRVAGRPTLRTDLKPALRGLRGTAPAVAAALTSLALGTAVALAVLGLYRIDSLVPLELHPRISLDPLPAPSWEMAWSGEARWAESIRSAGLAALLQLAAAFAVCVLVIGTASAWTVQLARASARRFELALAAAVGATRRRLLRQFAVEGAIFALAVTGAGLAVGAAGVGVLGGTWPHGDAAGSIDARVPALLLALVAVAAFGSSLTPRLRMTRRGWIGDAVAPEARMNPGTAAADVRRVLVVAQFAVALALAVSAGVLLRHATPAGHPAQLPYDPAGLAAVSLDASALEPVSRAGALAALTESARGIAGVAEAGVASPGAVVGAGAMDRVLTACPWCSHGGMALPLFPVYAQVHVVGPEFFDTLGVAVVDGRTSVDSEEPGDVIVNESFAKIGFQGGDVVGRRIQVGGYSGQWFTVVGVVRGISRLGIGEPGESGWGPGSVGATREVPAVYLPASTHPPGFVELVVRSPSPPGALDPALHDLASRLGLGVGELVPVAARIGRERAPSAWFGALMGVLALAVLGLAIHGLHALVHFTVALRRGEIGVRRAVGARRGEIGRQFLAEALTLATWGAVPGLVGALVLTRGVRSFFPGIPVFDGAVFLTCIAALSAATLLGAWLPARSAARLDPAAALRSE